MGHGHVTPNPNGSKARCGGPALCQVCAREQAALTGEWPRFRVEAPQTPAIRSAHTAPKIAINGQPLTSSETECLRVAVTAFLSEMSDDDALGNDEHGRLMTKAYRLAMERILSLWFA